MLDLAQRRRRLAKAKVSGVARIPVSLRDYCSGLFESLFAVFEGQHAAIVFNQLLLNITVPGHMQLSFFLEKNGNIENLKILLLSVNATVFSESPRQDTF